LRRLLALELPRRLVDVVVTEMLAEPLPHLADRLAGEARRIGTHVGDETDRALRTEVDALVELLRDLHRALARGAVAVRRGLLERARDERRLRVLEPRLHLDAGDRRLRALELLPQRCGFGARVLAADLPLLELALADAHEARGEALALRGLVVDLDRPVFL